MADDDQEDEFIHNLSEIHTEQNDMAEIKMHRPLESIYMRYKSESVRGEEQVAEEFPPLSNRAIDAANLERVRYLSQSSRTKSITSDDIANEQNIIEPNGLLSPSQSLPQYNFFESSMPLDLNKKKRRSISRQQSAGEADSQNFKRKINF